MHINSRRRHIKSFRTGLCTCTLQDNSDCQLDTNVSTTITAWLLAYQQNHKILWHKGLSLNNANLSKTKSRKILLICWSISNLSELKPTIFTLFGQKNTQHSEVIKIIYFTQPLFFSLLLIWEYFFFILIFWIVLDKEFL